MRFPAAVSVTAGLRFYVLQGARLTAESTDVTAVLQRWSAGERRAAEEAFPLVYQELRRIAAGQLRRERASCTLQPTAVVHEAYLRLREAEGVAWASRAQFYAFAAHVMRRVLVDHARRRRRLKRGGGARTVAIEEAAALAAGAAPDVLALDEALAALERYDRRKALIVELRFFGGLTLQEAARQLGVSEETAGREWRRAKAWLRAALDAPLPPARG